MLYKILNCKHLYIYYHAIKIRSKTNNWKDKYIILKIIENFNTHSQKCLEILGKKDEKLESLKLQGANQTQEASSGHTFQWQ